MVSAAVFDSISQQEHLLAQDCQACSTSCTQAALWSLERGSPYSCDENIGLLVDCANSSLDTSRKLMDPLANPIQACKITAQLCILCAESCEQLTPAATLIECACQLRQTAASLTIYIRSLRN
jgi:hypothetical protein